MILKNAVRGASGLEVFAITRGSDHLAERSFANGALRRKLNREWPRFCGQSIIASAYMAQMAVSAIQAVVANTALLETQPSAQPPASIAPRPISIPPTRYRRI